jgi:hypothetical protein
MPQFSQEKVTRCTVVPGICVLDVSAISAAHFRQLGA